MSDQIPYHRGEKRHRSLSIPPTTKSKRFRDATSAKFQLKTREYTQINAQSLIKGLVLEPLEDYLLRSLTSPPEPQPNPSPQIQVERHDRQGKSLQFVLPGPKPAPASAEPPFYMKPRSFESSRTNDDDGNQPTARMTEHLSPSRPCDELNRLAFSSESDFINILCPPFIRFPDGFTGDLGFHTGQITAPWRFRNPFLEMWTAFKKTQVANFVPFSVKCLIPLDRPSNGLWPRRTWILSVTEDELDLTGAIVVTSVDDTENVAIIPTACLKARFTSRSRFRHMQDGNHKQEMRLPLPSANLGFGQDVLFPYEFAAFVQPAQTATMTLSNDALINHRSWKRIDISRRSIKPKTLSVLAPIRENLAKVELAATVYTAFRDSGHTHDISIRPTDFPKTIGDLKLCGSKWHEESEEFVIRLHFGYTHVSPSIVDVVKFAIDDPAVRGAFYWDYIIAVLKKGTGRKSQITKGQVTAICVSRDSLLVENSWPSRSMTEKQIQSLVYSRHLENATINLDNPQHLVSEMVSVFRGHRTGILDNQTFKARISITPQFLPHEDQQQNYFHPQARLKYEFDEETRMLGVELASGSRNFAALEDEEVRVFRRLMALCRQNRQGLILRLGQHQMARFALMQHIWTDAECDAFDHDWTLPRTVMTVRPFRQEEWMLLHLRIFSYGIDVPQNSPPKVMYPLRHDLVQTQPDAMVVGMMDSPRTLESQDFLAIPSHEFPRPRKGNASVGAVPNHSNWLVSGRSPHFYSLSSGTLLSSLLHLLVKAQTGKGDAALWPPRKLGAADIKPGNYCVKGVDVLANGAKWWESARGAKWADGNPESLQDFHCW